MSDDPVFIGRLSASTGLSPEALAPILAAHRKQLGQEPCSRCGWHEQPAWELGDYIGWRGDDTGRRITIIAVDENGDGRTADRTWNGGILASWKCSNYRPLQGQA